MDYVFVKTSIEVIPALIAEVERLTAERNFAWKGVQSSVNSDMEWQKECNVWIDRAIAAEEERDGLLAALQNITHTFTENSFGDMVTLPAEHYQKIARRALEKKP
jgi:hypothetical protein